jgi:hypothetical protein
MSQPKSFIDVSLASLSKKPRQVFVAYSYRHYDKRDYRKCYEAIGKAFSVEFVFADEKITSLHILQKIANYIRESQFGIYDITAWNPNVTLELGLALGMGERVYIGLNPEETDLDDVPSDLKGVDRVQYNSFSSLEDELERLISQVLPPPPDPEAEDYLSLLQDKIVALVETSPGMNVTTIAKAAGVNTELAKLAVRNEVDKRLRMEGKTRGAKYWPSES